MLALTALVFNLYALRHVAGHLYRPHESRHRLLSGIALYPLAIVLLLLVLPNRRDIVAAAWGVLAFGDGMATIAGHHVRSPRIPWNRDKSVAGSAAFVLCGGAAASFLRWWCAPAVVPPAYLWFSIWMPVAGGDRRCGGRDDPDQARRQHYGARRGSSGAVGDITDQ